MPKRNVADLHLASVGHFLGDLWKRASVRAPSGVVFGGGHRCVMVLAKASASQVCMTDGILGGDWRIGAFAVRTLLK